MVPAMNISSIGTAAFTDADTEDRCNLSVSDGVSLPPASQLNALGGSASFLGAFPGFQYENGFFMNIPVPRPSDINNAGQIVGHIDDQRKCGVLI